MINNLFKYFNKQIQNHSRFSLVIFIVLVSLFFHFPSRFDWNGENFRDQKIKSENLLSNAFEDRNPNSHAAKLETRILVPLMINMFHLNKRGLIFISMFSGIMLLFCFYSYFNSLTNKINAFWITLAVSFTYSGSNAFVENRFMFDSLSLSLIFFGYLALEHIKRINIFVISLILITFAILNDERSVFTLLGFVLLSLTFSKNNKVRFAVCAAISLIIYIAFRLLLNQYFKVNTPTEGVGLTLFLDQISNIRIGYLMFGEGFFILIYYWFKYKSHHSRYLNILFLVYFISSLLSFTVVDISRSIIYWFPLFLIGFESLLIENNKVVQKVIYIICILCFFIPTYYVGGSNSVAVSFSLIEQGLFYLIGRY